MAVIGGLSFPCWEVAGGARWAGIVLAVGMAAAPAGPPPAFPPDPDQRLERTCFQTSEPWSEPGNLRSDVAIVYGIDAGLPERIRSWRDRGYRIHVMTGVSWGSYQDYLYGRFDGVNHEDEAQTVSDGRKSSHGGDVYYMCPSTSFGKFLCTGVQRALDAGAEAIHLEEPEFWVNAGYSEGFKREWQAHYGAPWQAPHSSVDAQWRASKLKYFLYRRALQQVFDHVQDHNRRTGRRVRCYVPTHSLLNYAAWEIVSPESSLARLDGCDGYIAQVWTGTARTPNKYRGRVRERTFETAFLEYGAMHNLVRATGRRIWYLNDPVEDNPDHDWDDYRRNWESTLVASLLQPEVWRYEVAPWPERVFRGRYPRSARAGRRQGIPPAYATELQTVMNALNDLRQKHFEWDCGTTGVGLLVSDSLMFQRGDPVPGDEHLGNVYGLALPLLKRGLPVAPVQLENVTLPHCLDGLRVLFLTYHGMKPLAADVHTHLAAWVRRGGVLVVCDDDSDPYLRVTEWWNSDGRSHHTPREHLFEQLGAAADAGAAPAGAQEPVERRCGKGWLLWLRRNPVRLADDAAGDEAVAALARRAAARASVPWRETNHLVLRRGPYVVAAGLDESVPGEPKVLQGRFVNLFDPELRVLDGVAIRPGERWFLRDLAAAAGPEPQLLAAACKALATERAGRSLAFAVEGVGHTGAVMLFAAPDPPRAVVLDGQPVTSFTHSAADRLLWIRFPNEARPRTLAIRF